MIGMQTFTYNEQRWTTKHMQRSLSVITKGNFADHHLYNICVVAQVCFANSPA